MRLIAGLFCAPYRMQGRRGKSDANDAAAICEAASRPQMHFVSDRPQRAHFDGTFSDAPLAATATSDVHGPVRWRDDPDSKP